MNDLSPQRLRALADALYKRRMGWKGAWKEDPMLAAVDALRAIADRDEAAGWVRVPVEPTEEMLAAGDSAAEPSGRRVDGAVIENWSEVYHAMIAAAPKPTGGEG